MKSFDGLPEGFIVFPEIVTPSEERRLLARIETLDWQPVLMRPLLDHASHAAKSSGSGLILRTVDLVERDVHAFPVAQSLPQAAEQRVRILIAVSLEMVGQIPDRH